MSKSNGHVEFIDGYEYYKLPDGRLFRAEITKPLDANGRRPGEFVSQPQNTEGATMLTEQQQRNLTGEQLFHLASGGDIQLTQADKNRMKPDYLFHLASGGDLQLTQEDRNRLRPEYLFHLASGRQLVLTEIDKRRLTREQLVFLALGQ